MRSISSVLLVLFLWLTSCLQSRSIQEMDSSQFIGVWVDEKDSKHQWIFTGDNLTIKYPGSSDDVYFYNVSNSSPQCGETASTTSGFTYLSLTDANNQEKTCYYVNGFAEVISGRRTLSLSEFNRSGVIVFVKQ